MIPLKRVNKYRDAQDADQMMPSILFPPLLSLDSSDKDDGEASISSPSNGGGGISSCGAGSHDPWSFEIFDQEEHDCSPRRPSSETRRYSSHRRMNEEAVSCMHYSQSMPSFEHIALKMSEKNNMDDNNVAAAPEMTAYDDTNNNNDTPASAAAEGGLDHDVPFPTYIPKLRIRRISSDMDLKIMPSPLARRGGKEMEYLQKQLKAEAFIRRKQQQHNEERNKRRGDRNNDDIDALEDGDTFFANAPFHCRRGSRPNNTIMDLAASPPAILKNLSLKRSVSETLKDSGIPEDANLLFTPMGMPLIDDDDDVAKDNNHDEENTILGNEGDSSSETEEIFAMDEDGGRMSQYEFLVTDEGVCDCRSDDDDGDDIELSPSLMPAGMHYQLGDSSVHEVKVNSPTTNAYKKITLRPKMKVRTDSSDFSTQLGTYLYKLSDQDNVSTSYGNEPTSKDDTMMEKVDLTSADKGRYASPQKSRFGRLAAQRFFTLGSESFDALTLEDRLAINNDAMYTITNVKTAESDASDRLDTSDRFGVSPSFSESNYATPDNSFSNRPVVRASKLWSMNQGPELPLTTSPFPEQNFHTPSSSHSRRHRERMGLPNPLPAAPLFGATIEEEITGVMPSEATPEPNVATPQNLSYRTACNNLLRIPQFAELVVPQLGSSTKPEEVGAAPTSEEEKKEFDEEELRDHIHGPQ